MVDRAYPVMAVSADSEHMRSSVSAGDGAPSPIWWGRAAFLSLVVLVVGAVLFMYVPNWVLTHLTGLSRDGRVAVATTGFFVLFFAFAWVLRRLQARGVI